MERLPSFLRSLRLKAPVSSWAAISDLEISLGGTQPSNETPGFEEIKYTKPLTHFQKLMGEGAEGPGDLRLARHSEEVAERFREIIDLSHAEGRLNTSISEDVRARFGLSKKALRVLDPDCPAPTITSLPDDLLHYREPRALTVRENARLQTFPDWFSFKGKYTTGGYLRKKEVPRFTQVANAVPPLVSRAIGEMLREDPIAEIPVDKNHVDFVGEGHFYGPEAHFNECEPGDPMCQPNPAMQVGQKQKKAPTTSTIRPESCTLAYFLPVIDELLTHPAPDNYLEYLRLKLRQLAGRKDRSAEVQKKTFSDDR